MTYDSSAVRDEQVDVGAMLSAVVRRLPRIVLVSLVLVAVTFAVLMFVPRLYESTASILVEPRSNVYTRATNEAAPSISGGEAGVVSSQVALIKSRDTLLKVIDQLDLRSVPEFNGVGNGGFSPFGMISRLLGKQSTPVSIDETVLNNLYDRLSVSQEKDSRVISVSVSSTDPQRAADIANAVANAHVARRAGLSLSDTAEASGWLREEIDRLRLVVERDEKAVADFKIKNDLFTGSNNTSLVDQQLSAIAGQISAAQERRSTATSRATMIRGMLDRGQSIEGVADVRDSVLIQSLSEEKARLQGEKAQRSATLLASHPTMRALTAQIAELDKQIAIEGRRVADALESEAQIEADLESSLQNDLAGAKVSSSTATQDTVTLDGLQREAKAQRDLLEGYLQRYNEAFSRTETNSDLPDVRVVSLAAPSVTPASPKTQLILAVVGIASVLVQIGLIVFSELMSGRAIVAGAAPVRPQDELEDLPFSQAELEPDQQIDPEVASDGQFAGQEETEEEFAPSRYEEPEVVRPVEPSFEHVDYGEPLYAGRDIGAALDAQVEGDTADVAEALAEIEDERFEDNEPTVTAMADWEAPGTSEQPEAATAPEPVSLGALTADLVLGRTHLVMLAAHRAHADCEAVADELVAEALARGLSVALVDAGSASLSEAAGLSDLSSGKASFGDIVHKSADNSFAEVPWGRARAILRSSSKPLTLVEALGDIYEVVVLLTGRVGMNSTLPMFAGIDGRVVLVAGPEDDEDAVADSREQLLEAGFDTVEVAQGPSRAAA